MSAALAERGVHPDYKRNFADLSTRPFKAADAYMPPDEGIARDLAHHKALQRQFDSALGQGADSKDLLERAYNPVSDRLHIEKLRREGDKLGEVAYGREMHKNLETKLKERLLVSENEVRYDIKDNELYSEHFPKEPFNHVLERGAEYRLAHGTQEADREGLKGERGGWEKIRQKFTNPETEVGTKMTSFSPRGSVKGSSYERNVVDEYELAQDKKGKYVKLTRYLVDFDQADYYTAAISLDPQVFEGYDGRPPDAWLLSHPVEGSLPDLKNYLSGMSSEMFNKIYESKLLQDLMTYYMNRITDKTVDWRQVALSFNAILNQVDREEQRQKTPKQQDTPVYLSQDSVYATVQTLGWQMPEERGGAGCPTSKGYKMSNGSMGFSMSGSVGQFSLLGSGATNNSERFTCPRCHKTADGPIGNTCPHCKLTKAEWSAETGISCD